ncbi:hypothetical protein [Salinimonas iocasae]|uniref:Uncharacterized protein n=1 Tax=Salinimonas iocasae TaxID=2572577 RepID=A0A5B7YFW1_9ALTE|nr:hypothetical protein [Salinimonas iocasae]QCZ94408.1 hypothetical protein FBQ74_13445 [Salinimonas iocasae]
MFEHIKQAQEREISKDSEKIILSMKNDDYLSAAHHISSLLIAALAFILIIIGMSFLEGSRPNNFLGYGLLLTAGMIIIFHESKKRKRSYIKKYAHVIVKTRLLAMKYWFADYLAKYFWLSLAVLLATSVLILEASLTGVDGWASAELYQGRKYSSSITMAITTASGLLASQVALFSFMMQQVHSKYSGVVAQTVASHRSFKLLALYPVIGLSTPFLLHNFGAPKSIESLILPAIGFMMLVGLLLTVMVAKAGLSESRAVRYFGVASAKRINTVMLPPIKVNSQVYQYFWRSLNFLGLDFRNKDRFQLITPPSKGYDVAMESIGALLGIANKAALEGQHDVFISSLISIEATMEAYAAKRKYYVSSEDEVFTYLNYQFCALVESTSKIPNQYLISNLTSSVGNIAKLTYSIGNIPRELVEDGHPGNSNNFTTALWMGLLVQCFEHTHTLTRSTAAHASIGKMSDLAKTSIMFNDSDAITLTYLPSIKKVYALCITQLNDAYHKELAGACLSKLMENLMTLSVFRDTLRGTHQDAFEETLNLICDLSKLYLAVDSSGSLTLNDPLNIALTKTSADKNCMQEIFFVVANKDISGNYSYRVAISDLRKIIEKIHEMATFSLRQNIYTSYYYLHALFEVLYLVVRGLPTKFNEYDEMDHQEQANFGFDVELVSTEQMLIELITDKLQDLTSQFYKSERVPSEWQHSVFSSLGILIIRFTDREEEFIKDKVTDLVNSYYLLVKNDIDAGKRAHYDSEKYLQLVGAWIRHFDLGEGVAQNIEYLLTSITISRNHRGGREKYGQYGYPVIHHNDFFLYPLRNIRHPKILTEDDVRIFSTFGDRLINDEILIPFARNLIEKRMR